MVQQRERKRQIGRRIRYYKGKKLNIKKEGKIIKKKTKKIKIKENKTTGSKRLVVPIILIYTELGRKCHSVSSDKISSTVQSFLIPTIVPVTRDDKSCFVFPAWCCPAGAELAFEEWRV